MSPADAEKKLWGALPKSPLAFELRFRGVMKSADNRNSTKGGLLMA